MPYRISLPALGAQAIFDSEVGDADEIPARLVRVRRHMGLTQEQMAKRLRLNPKTYARSENAGRNLEAPELIELHKLGTDIVWVLIGEGEMMRASAAIPDAGAMELREGNGPPTFSHKPRDPLRTQGEVQQIYGATVTRLDDAIRRIGWQPPRSSEEALRRMLFDVALAHGLDAAPTMVGLIDLLNAFRRDIERHNPST